MPNWQTSNGTLPEIWDCNGGSNQIWHYDNTSFFGYGAKCLDDPNGINTDGTLLGYWDCNGGRNQSFLVF